MQFTFNFLNNDLVQALFAIPTCVIIIWLYRKSLIWLIRKTDRTQRTYDIQYRAYLKMFNGAERSTDIINVTIKARNEADMKKQLQEYVSKNIKVEFAQIRKNES